MCYENIGLQIKTSKKPSCLSFKKLEDYFKDHDLKIQNLCTISAQQFITDLDSVIDFSRKRLGSCGKIDKISIIVDSGTAEKKEQHLLDSCVQKRKKSKFHKILNKIFKQGIHTLPPLTKIAIDSWSFKDFDETKTFQVGKFYTIRPVSITYNSAQQDYKYDNQIISEFCIKEANGKFKKLVVIDNIKKGTTRREKYIDGQKIHHQQYNLEIRNHRLNRCLMKTFLFHRIYRLSEYDQDSSLLHNKTDSNFIVEKTIPKVSCQTKGATISIFKVPGKIPEEYIKIPVCKESAQNKEKTAGINNIYVFKHRHDNDAFAEDHVKAPGFFDVLPGLRAHGADTN